MKLFRRLLKLLTTQQPLPEGITVRNTAPRGADAFHEAAGRPVSRFYKLVDLIRAEKDTTKQEKLCREQIQIGAGVIVAEKLAAKLNRQKFQPLCHVGYDCLSSILYVRREWQQVLDLEREARSAGWDTRGMVNRVEVSKRKLEI